MKTILKAGFAVLAFALVFSTWVLADGGADTYKARCAMCHMAPMARAKQEWARL